MKMWRERYLSVTDEMPFGGAVMAQFAPLPAQDAGQSCSVSEN
jgi:hypothetical protein